MDERVAPRTPASGFSLVEMVIVVGVAGALLAWLVPSFKRFQDSTDLHSTAHQISEQLLLTRQKAIATGTTQQIRFIKNFGGTSDYHIWDNNVAYPSWRLPRNINYQWGSGTQNSYRMTSDGRCMDSGFIILENAHDLRDTISVRVSGLVFVY